MPARNSVKQFVDGSFYHLYNRGVDKREIFLDDQDYRVFLSLLKLYLEPNEPSVTSKIHKDISSDIKLVAYCLMPNHFHLLMQQVQNSGITEFMRCVNTRYVMYFNKRNKRQGSLFQGIYKAVSIDHDNYLIHLSRYIHLNPLNLEGGYQKYQYSSYRHYLGTNPPRWLDSKIVLSQFKTTKSYQDFVADLAIDSAKVLSDLIIE